MDPDGWLMTWIWETVEIACDELGKLFLFISFFLVIVFVLLRDSDGTLSVFRFVEYIHIYLVLGIALLFDRGSNGVIQWRNVN